MSSATVKFGAEDIGLEKTLKRVQTELSDLKGKVESGDQSMSELEKTMKRMGQLESLEKRLKGMGNSAAESSPKINELGDQAKTMGKKAEDAGDRGHTSLGKIGAGAAIAGAAFAAGMKVMEVAADAARAVIDSFGQALDLGGRLNDLKERTGESAGSLLILERAFDNTGVGADKVGTSINKLQKFITDASDGAGKQAEIMARLGISMQDLEGKTPTEQMQVFAQKISGIQDPTARAATAMEVFGKSGGQLLPILNNFSGELETAKGQLGSMPGIMDKTSSAFDTISDNLTVAKGKIVEFGAGLLQGAAPALEKFSAMLTGVDAAGWGQKLGEVVMRVADLLIGAFKSPQAAIDAIGLALNTGVLTMGNLLVNKFIDAVSLLKNFWSSEMPSLLTNQFGTALKITFIDSVKFFADQILGVVKAYNSDFGRATADVAKFFTESFSSLIKLISSDFVQALTNPLGFVTGKIKSALDDSFTSGGITFKSALTDSFETSLGKFSSGLGATSAQYSSDLLTGTIKISDEWNKITSNVSNSAVDFFGAEPAVLRLNEKMKEVEEVGKSFREEFTAATDDAAKNTEKIPPLLQDAENSSLGINANLAGAGADLRGNTSQAKDNMKEIKTIGDLIAAQDAAKPMRSFKEESAAVRADLKALKEFIGEDLSKMSWPDIAKKMGIDRTKKEQRELFDEIKQRLEEIKNTEIDLKINGDASLEELEQIKENIATIGLEDIVLTFDAPLSDIASGLAELASSERELDLTADGALSEIASALPGYFENPLSLAFEADSSLQEVESSLNTLGSEPVELNLNASGSVEKIRSELSKEIDIAVNSSEGTKILTSINSFVDAIKSSVLKLEQKLPQTALGA